jgi:hypothetical protein
VLSAGLSTGIADVVAVTHGMNLGLRPMTGNGVALSIAALMDSEGPLAERRYQANAGFLWSLGQGKVRGVLGGMLGGGLVRQSVDGTSTRQSGFFQAGPVLGLTTRMAGRFGLWSELELPAVLYRADATLALSFMPSAWLGGSFEL